MQRIIWFGLMTLVSGCSVAPTAVSPPQAGVEPVWPAPPLAPRIRYLSQIRAPADPDRQVNLLKRITRRLFGADSASLVRPVASYSVAGKIYVADPGAQGFWIIDPDRGRFRLVQQAGKESLMSPVAITGGARGDLYLADSALGKVLRYDLEGKFLASLNSTRGQTSELKRPVALAFSQNLEQLYIADVARHEIWITDPDGKRLGRFGGRGTKPGRFNFPTHLSLDDDDQLLVTDALNFRIQTFDSEGHFLSSFGHQGDGSGDLAAPKGIAVDHRGNVLVVDALFDAVQIFDSQGKFLLSFGSRGTGSGQFWLPGGIIVTPDNRILVTDTYNRRIQEFQIIPDDGE